MLREDFFWVERGQGGSLIGLNRTKYDNLVSKMAGNAQPIANFPSFLHGTNWAERQLLLPLICTLIAHLNFYDIQLQISARSGLLQVLN